MRPVTDIRDHIKRMEGTEGHVLRIIRTVQSMERQIAQIILDNPQGPDAAMQTLASQYITFGAKPPERTLRPVLAFTDWLQDTHVPTPEPGQKPDMLVTPTDLFSADSAIRIHGSYAPVTVTLSTPFLQFLEHWNNLSLTLDQSDDLDVHEAPVNNVRPLHRISSGPELGA
jgi:hypothetical protein